jgi:hypothetical protein
VTAIRKNADRLTETDIDEEIVIMRLSNGEFFALSETSAAIWRLIDGERDRAALLAALADEYSLDDPARVESDVDEFLARMEEMGLLADR